MSIYEHVLPGMRAEGAAAYSEAVFGIMRSHEWHAKRRNDR